MTPEYKHSAVGNAVIHIGTGANIPLPAGESYGFAYAEYVANGGVTASADLPPTPTYKQLRAPLYPPVTDGLDAMVKGGQAWEDYKAACLAVKAKYPKPQTI